MRPPSWLGRFRPNPGQFEQNVFWFPVRITDVLASGYLFEEVEISPAGVTRTKRGGRQNTARDPGYALFDGSFGDGDGALCRWAPGAGNRAWELVDIDKRMSGSGTGDIAGGCDLETISFDVVTAVSCDASGGLTVTTRRVSITGCNLSVSQGDPPAAGSGSGGGGTAFATDCQGTGESLEAHPDVSLSITDGPYSGVYALVWASPAASPVSGDAWQADATISGVPHRFSLFSAGPPGDIRWYLWVTNLNTSGTLVVIAASGACDPFSLAFPGADLGSADDVTVVIPP